MTCRPACMPARCIRSEEHTSELQSRSDLVCRLLLEKKKNTQTRAVRADGLESAPKEFHDLLTQAVDPWNRRIVAPHHHQYHRSISLPLRLQRPGTQ